MIRSMTGYGIAEQTYNAKKISVEVKTLNSKQLDLQVKLPNELRFAELDFRNRIGTKLQRGKVDVVITITDTDLSQTYHIDQDIVKAYKDQIEAISIALNVAPADDMASILFRMPGIFNVPVENYDEAFVAKVAETLDQALDIVDGFRIQEGNTLKKDLLHRVELILDLLGQVEPYEKSRHEVIKQRITKNLSELTTAGQYDENRFEQELIYYLEYHRGEGAPAPALQLLQRELRRRPSGQETRLHRPRDGARDQHLRLESQRGEHPEDCRQDEGRIGEDQGTGV